MKKKIEKQVWINVYDGCVHVHNSMAGAQISGAEDKATLFAHPATLTYEIDEPDQTVTITESQLENAFRSYSNAVDIKKVLGFK